VKERIGSLPSVSAAFGPAGPIYLGNPGATIQAASGGSNYRSRTTSGCSIASNSAWLVGGVVANATRIAPDVLLPSISSAGSFRRTV
jgi:hypothetical protein